MKRISDKRRAELDSLPAVLSVPEPEYRHAEEGATDHGFQEFVRRLPCAVCLGPSIKGEPCHYKTRERWGDWIVVEGVLQGNIWPGCPRHHREQHNSGVLTFEARHGVSLAEVSAVVGRAYLAGLEPETLGAAVRGGYEAVEVDDIRPGLDLF